MQSDQRLSNLYRRGVDPAYDELVERYRASLTAFAAAIVGSDRAEDVVQESLVKAHRAMAAEEVEEPRAWLYRVVRNTALNEIRDGKKHEHAELSGAELAGLTPEREVESREEFKALVTALAALPAAQRQAIVDRELGGYTHEEIARNLEVSTGATKQLIFRARNGLRNSLGALIPAPLIIWLAQEMTGAFASASSAGTVAGAAGGAGAAGSAGGVAAGTGGILGGLAGGGATKIAAIAVVATGTVAAGVAVEERVVGGDSESPSAIEETVVESSGGVVFREDGTPVLVPGVDSETDRDEPGEDRLGTVGQSEGALEEGRVVGGPGARPGEDLVPGRSPDGPSGGPGGPDRPSGVPGRPGGSSGGPVTDRPTKPGGAGSPAGGPGGSADPGGSGGRPSGGSGGPGNSGGSGGSGGSGNPGGGRPSGGSGGSGNSGSSGGSGGSGGSGNPGGGRPSSSGSSGNSPAAGGSPGGSGAKPGGGGRP